MQMRIVNVDAMRPRSSPSDENPAEHSSHERARHFKYYRNAKVLCFTYMTGLYQRVDIMS